MKYTVVLPPSLGGLVKSIKAGEEEAAFDGDGGNVEVAVVEDDTGSGKVDGVVENVGNDVRRNGAIGTLGIDHCGKFHNIS